MWNEAFDQYGAAQFPPATPAPSELDEGTLVHVWFSPSWYDPPTGLPVSKTVGEVAETGRDVIISFPWYLNVNATAGPSFASMYLQDVQSNKTCTMTTEIAANNAEPSLQCTCYGRRGDVETGCYDVSNTPEVLNHVLGGEVGKQNQLINLLQCRTLLLLLG